LPYSFNGYNTTSQYLNIYYSYIFEHWYSYDINDENEEKIKNLLNPNSEYNLNNHYKLRVEEMLQREHDLLFKWISFKAETDLKAMHLRTVKELWEYLVASTLKWFQSIGILINNDGT
jgi:hypothetical protein